LPTDAAATVRIDAAKAVAATLLMSGVQLDKVEKLAEKALSQAFDEKIPANMTAYRDLTEAVADRVKSRIQAGLKRVDRAGAVKVAGSVEVMSFVSD